jgi:type IV pilus assembly protein PilC
MEFRCRLGTPGGEVLEEVHVADSEAHLRHELEGKGFCVLALHPRRSVGGLSFGLPKRRRVPTREFLVFNQELATLLKAGMPLVQSLEILRQRVSNPVFKAALDDVHVRVRAGAALSEAFGTYTDLFPGVYTASLLAGEKSGNLEGVLRRYVGYVKVVGTVKRRTVAALIYPVVLMALATVVVGIIVLRVIPAFSDFYSTFGAELPLATRIIVTGATTLREHILVIALVVIGVLGLLTGWFRNPSERERFDRWTLRIPAVGPIVRKFVTSQLARTLATLLGGGIPLVNSIEIAARAIANRHMAKELEAVGSRVREGEAFAAALQARGVFPAVAVKMVEVGESTGALEDMLNSLADFYDEEIDTDLGRFVALVEPALLVIMGLVIASLLLALYMPLFQLTSVTSTM